jgi:hypothetical protein
MATMTLRSDARAALAGPQTLHPVALQKMGVPLPEESQPGRLTKAALAWVAKMDAEDAYEPTEPCTPTEEYSPTSPRRSVAEVTVEESNAMMIASRDNMLRQAAEFYWTMHEIDYVDKTPEEQKAAKEKFVNEWVMRA